MHVGWIFSSFLMVAGSSIISTLAWIIAGAIGGGWGLLLFWFIGAFFAGFAAARASEGKTIAEPAIGAGIFVAAGIVLLLKAFEDVQSGLSIEAVKELELWYLIAYLVLSFSGGGIGGAYVGAMVRTVFLGCQAARTPRLQTS